MKRILQVCFIVFASITAQAQVVFRTIVTQGPVVVGDPFQVQYVLEDLDKDAEFIQPDFKSFRFVSGPNIYAGSAFGEDGPKKLKNIVFALSALRPGKFIVPGANARVNGLLIRSENAVIEVISKADAISRGMLLDIPEPNGDYFLRPGEDPYQKMRNNLFMKVTVNKRNCYVGEPVTATFKLYSRLESKSDIVKNPGFYGFTVQDMIGLNEKVSGTETINGKKFDVHTIRKVQLYPLQAGLFTIDPMEVQNKVEFSRTIVNKKTEQEIVEGVFADGSGSKSAGTETFENSMSTEPVAIRVNPVPLKESPGEFNGATGRFEIFASLKKDIISKNEEGDLVITIKGKGNFTQLAAPTFQWPKGIEGFEPEITDSLDPSHAPMKGERVFRFRFVSNKPGNYILPAVSFSFFDPDSNHYKTASTKSLPIKVSNVETKLETKESSAKHGGRSRKTVFILAAAILIAATTCYIILRRRSGRKVVDEIEITNERPAITELFRPASVLLGADDKTFYSALRKGIWDFFSMQFSLSGSKMNKYSLGVLLQGKKVNREDEIRIMEILTQCDTGIFTNAEIEGDKKAILEETRQVLERISRYS